MISSMTGYGKAAVQEGSLSVNVEIKSLNSRFLDLSLKVPKILADKELEIRNIVKDRIKRGKVIVNIYVEKVGDENKVAEIDESNLNALLNVLKELRIKSGVNSEITLDHLLAFQGLIFSEQVEDNTTEFNLASRVLEDAIKNLVEMRRQEGVALVKDLRERLDVISNCVLEIEKIHRTEIEAYFDKLKSRAKDLLKDLDQYDDRLKMELALLAEKNDVTEECIRLKSHIQQFSDTLDNGAEVGRRMNFIIQEMNREANTINSKSISSNVTNIGITIKEELERIREQIQNIE